MGHGRAANDLGCRGHGPTPAAWSCTRSAAAQGVGAAAGRPAAPARPARASGYALATPTQSLPTIHSQRGYVLSLGKLLPADRAIARAGAPREAGASQPEAMRESGGD